MNRLPLLIPSLGWLSGLAIARIDTVSFEIAGILAVLLTVLLFSPLLNQTIRILIITTLIGMLWGMAALFWDVYRVSVDESWLSGRQQVVAEIEQVEISSAYLRLRLIDVKRDDGAELIKNGTGKIDVYLYGKDRKLTLLSGQMIQASVKLHLPGNKLNPGGFDYRAYCFDKHIALIGSAKNVVLIDDKTSLLEKTRQRIISHLPYLSLNSSFNHDVSSSQADDGSGIIRALLLADRNHIPISVQDAFAAAGAAHLLAISGLHVGMVAGWGFVIVWWLLTRRETWIVHLPVRKIALSTGLLAAVLYATVAGWPITAQRSVLMMAAAILAWWLRSRSEPLNTMLAALVLLLLVDPAAIVSISLWLSFVAVTALLVWVGREKLQKEREVEKEKGAMFASLRKWAAGLFWVSLLAAMATLPIIADLFGRIPTYTLVANLLLVPLYSLYVLPLSILGEISAILSAGDVASWLFSMAAIGVTYGNSFLILLKTWPAGNLWVPDIPLMTGLLYGTGILISVFFLLRKNYVALLLCSSLSLFLYLTLVIPERYPEHTHMTVWDVGQGAGATLAMPDGKVMVIDVPGRYGSKFNGGTMLAAGLREQGLVHVDVLVLSHAQSDHAGGAGRLLDHLRSVREVWLADVPANRDYRAMNDVVARVLKQGGDVHWLKQGDEVAFGETKVEILWPPKGFDPANGNHTSLVLSMQLASGQKLLFPGDVEKASELKIIQQGLGHHDVTLIPHHGSRTSSSEKWVEDVSSTIAIAQTGWKNRYGFPYPDVMQRYQKQGVQLRDTKYGAVTIRFDDKPGLSTDRGVDSGVGRGMKIEQFQSEMRGKRETALQWWQAAL